VPQTLELDLTTKQWSVSSSPFPFPISDATMVGCGSSYVLFGGWDDETLYGDLWVSSQKTDDAGAAHYTSWSKIRTVGERPGPRRGHSMISTTVREDGNCTIYIFGGFDGSKRLNELWSIDLQVGTDHVAGANADKTWSLVHGDGECPAPRDACAMAFDSAHHRLVLFGGFTTALDRELFIFEIAQKRWSRPVFAVGPSKRQLCSGVCHQANFLAFLGHDGKSTLSQVCQWNLAESKWTVVGFDGDEVEPRLYSAVCLADGGKKVLIFGGQSKGKYLSSLLELELEKCEVVAAGKGKK
jgi:hypothetical protein